MSDSREARFKRLLQQERRRNRQLTEGLQEALDLLENTPDVEAIKTENEQLKAAMTEGAYRAAFEEAAREAGVDPDCLEDLWTLAPPAMDPDAEPDPRKIAAHVKAAIAGRKILLAAREDDDQGDDEASDANADAGDETNGDPFGYFDEDEDEAGPALKTQPQPRTQAKAKPQPVQAAAKKTPTLGDGEGARRGARAASVNRDPYARIDAEFAATGRTDPFKI